MMPRLVVVIFLLIAAGVLALLVVTDDDTPTASGPGEDAPAVDLGDPGREAAPEISPRTEPETMPGPEEVTIPEGERTLDVGAEEPASPDTVPLADPVEGEEAAEDEPTLR